MRFYLHQREEYFAITASPNPGNPKWDIARVYDKKIARLIAAAPGLLAALKGYINVPVLPDVGHEDELINAINNARAAIAAAEEVTP